MKRKHTVKRHLAVLLAAILLATSLPVSALAAINLGGGENDDWKAEVELIPEVWEAPVGSSVNVTIQGQAFERKLSEWVETPSNAKAKTAITDITKEDIIITKSDGTIVNGDQVTVSDIVWDGMNGTFQVKSNIADEIGVSIDGLDDKIGRYMIWFYNEPVVTGLKEVNYAGSDTVPVCVDDYTLFRVEATFANDLDYFSESKFYEKLAEKLEVSIGDSDAVIVKDIGIREDKVCYNDETEEEVMYCSILVRGNKEKLGATTTLTITCPDYADPITYNLKVMGDVKFLNTSIMRGKSPFIENAKEELMEKMGWTEDTLDDVISRKYWGDYGYTEYDFLEEYIRLPIIEDQDKIRNLVAEKASEQIKEGHRIYVEPVFTVTDMTLDYGEVNVKGEKPYKDILVTDITGEYSVDIYYYNDADDESHQICTLSDLLSENGIAEHYKVYVAVPNNVFYNNGYTEWNHYDSAADLAAGVSNNEVLKDRVTKVLERDPVVLSDEEDGRDASYVAYAETTSDGFFTLKFVTEDNKNDDKQDEDTGSGGGSSEESGSGSSGSGSGSGSSDSGSGSSSSSSGSSSGSSSSSSGGSRKPSSSSSNKSKNTETAKTASSKTEQPVLPEGTPEYVVAGSWTQEGESWKFADADGNAYVSKWAAVYNPYAHVDQGQSDFDWFMFDADGHMVTGWYLDTDGNYYYLNPTSDGTKGKMMTGWIQDGGEWYYLSPVSDGARGHMVTGWVQDGDKWYYLSSVSDGKKGHMVTGWQQIGGIWYYLDLADGHMLVNTTTPDGYMVNASGAWVQ